MEFAVVPQHDFSRVLLLDGGGPCINRFFVALALGLLFFVSILSAKHGGSLRCKRERLRAAAITWL
jgi:hypothetical protein